MSIKSLQAKVTPLGRIRLGQFVAAGKGRPEKLDTFRFTSASERDIRVIADLYGGEAKPWQHRTLNQPQFEVVTEAKLVPVFVMPQKIDPFMELWGKGFCTRRCDGEQELLSGNPCICDAEDNRQCKPTTRFSVLLADLQGLGGWGVESHGWNAAGELAMLAGALEHAPAPVPADLVIDWRQEKKLVRKGVGEPKLETYQYAVPVLRFKWFTPQQAFAGQLEAAGWGALEGGPQRLAIGGGAQTVIGREELLGAIAAAGTRDAILELRPLADGAGLGEEWTARAREIHAAEQGSAPAEPVVEAEVVDEEAMRAEADALWQQIVGAAGKKGWNTAQLTAAAGAWLSEHHGTDHWTATPAQFRAFAAAIEAGEVKP
jgi:hypothetical protein